MSTLTQLWLETAHGFSIRHVWKKQHYDEGKEMGMEVDGRSPEMKSFLEELKRLEFQGYEFEAADASFDLLLKRFLRGEDLAFKIYDIMSEYQVKMA